MIFHFLAFSLEKNFALQGLQGKLVIVQFSHCRSVYFVPLTGQNGKVEMKIILKLFLTFCVTFGAVDGFAKGRVELKSRDICGNYNGHRKYIELGEKGEIFASNITVPKVRGKFRLFARV